MENAISKAIVEGYLAKLSDCLELDVAIVGAGPSGLVAAYFLANAGKKVAIFERKLAPGGGIWGGGMFFNEVVFQEEALPLLEEFAIAYKGSSGGLYLADSIEVASTLILKARKSGAVILNGIAVEDIVFKEKRVTGIVINWGTVRDLAMPVDPLLVSSRALIDGTGHPSEVVEFACSKAGVEIDTPSGAIVGEKPMWVEEGEKATVEKTKCLYPGLYASGMAATNASGGYRMGPIFGGMLLSGKKVAELVTADLGDGD